MSKSFYDTLRVKAEKNKLTRLLYDFLIVTPDSSGNNRERMSSTRPFDKFEGLIIRNIQILRLNAFGTNIDNPSAYNPTHGEKALNASYIKTQKFVFQKYLLFKKGDRLSPLIMSDNERFLRDQFLIEDARIIVVPVSGNEADVIVVIRESYPIGFNMSFKKINQGRASVFDRNFAGIGHELDINIPFNFIEYSSPGIGATYTIKNIYHTYSNLTFNVSDGLGSTMTGIALSRPFVSSQTKFSWYVSVSRAYAREDLDTMKVPAPLRYTYQDYWLSRSFLIDKKNVTRLIGSVRYINNNVFTKPEIDNNSFYKLQSYKLYIGSIAVSSRKFYNASLIYSFGRTEDIPYGYLAEVNYGIENNEFKNRSYLSLKGAYGNLFDRLGYVYVESGISTFYNKGNTEQGMFELNLKHFTPIIQLGSYKMRNFFTISYIRGFNRYTNEFLSYDSSLLIRGFSNDSVRGDHRLILSLEPVIFSPKTYVGFRFAFFAFTDTGITILGCLHNGERTTINAVGVGVRMRNDQLLFNTIQIRLGYYPVLPEYSRSAWFTIDGLARLRPPGLDPMPPGVMNYY